MMYTSWPSRSIYPNPIWNNLERKDGNEYPNRDLPRSKGGNDHPNNVLING